MDEVKYIEMKLTVLKDFSKEFNLDIKQAAWELKETLSWSPETILSFFQEVFKFLNKKDV